MINVKYYEEKQKQGKVDIKKGTDDTIILSFHQFDSETGQRIEDSEILITEKTIVFQIEALRSQIQTLEQLQLQIQNGQFLQEQSDE